MSFSRQVLVGLVSGLLLGLFLGELVAPLKVAADGFVKLLQMTVLPYVTVSIISSLGSLSAEDAKRLGLRAGAVLVGLWIVAIGFALLFPLAFPAGESASFFSTTLIEKRQPFNFVDLYIPSNPFHSLANNVVPAVVLFAVVLGVALIGVERKQVLLDVLSVLNALVARATRFVVQLTPYGIFAIAANAAGTLNVEQLGRIQIYLVTYVAIALLVGLWILPGLVSMLTPIGYREVLGVTRDALITAFMAGDLFIVLPILTEACKDLLARHQLADESTRGLPDVIVPASFNFPHTGKLLSLSFILFAGWFADASVRLADYPRLALTGFLTFFGSLNAAVPFLLDLFRIPADTFQLFLATGVINSRFGSLLAALHTVAVALLGSVAITGRLRFDVRRIVRFAIVTALLTVATIAGLRILFSSVLRQEFAGAEIVYSMRPVFPQVEARLLATVPETAAVPGPVLKEIRRRGALRVCVLPNRLPYTFPDRSGQLTGLDIEMANGLGRDLGVRLELVPVDDYDRLADALERAACDIAMSGVPVTPQRASTLLFSAPYLDETLGFIVLDELRDQFSSWSRIRALGPVRIGAFDLSYYVSEVRERAPSLQVDVVVSTARDFTKEIVKYDVFLLSAERGSVFTLLNPQYTVVVPEPDIVKVPLAYPVARHDERWAGFVNTWIELKRRDGTIDRLYRHWILGQDAVERKPRWSIVRNVLHWVE